MNEEKKRWSLLKLALLALAVGYPVTQLSIPGDQDSWSHLNPVQQFVADHFMMPEVSSNTIECPAWAWDRYYQTHPNVFVRGDRSLVQEMDRSLVRIPGRVSRPSNPK